MESEMIGREQEKELLKEYLASNKSEFIAVYGRRRVGKTFFVRQVIGGSACFVLTGMENAGLQDQLANFFFTLRKYYPVATHPKSWIEAFYGDIAFEHMVFPGMVYITFATEMGTIYTRAELEAIYGVCKHYGLPLFIDGARMGYGLMAEGCDISLPQLARLCDVFYLGGTKCGALCGEAVVFSGMTAPDHFFTTIKQHGALMAKGRLLGVQFDTLMQDGLYFKIARHAVEQAMRLRDAFVARGYKMYSNSPTNQQFVLLDKATIDRLEKDFVFEQWFPVGDMMNCRFVTSWATSPQDVDALIAAL